MKEIIATDTAPGAVGPYSQATRSGDLVFCSGQIGIDPVTGALAEGVEAQAERVLENLAAVLDAAGATLDDVLKTTVYLASIEDFKTVNGVYARFFTKNQPARAAFAVNALPLGALVEIEAVARVG
ncbi:MAG: hypothetical protein JW876_10605 [Candidatus Krumholzibacteriota bacterium]|nr:hypothetical protein [Candidatus Krumholzibacteriota bacterium]